MLAPAPDIQTLQAELKTLVDVYRKTRVWFWRLGASSLAAAAAWILIWVKASRDVTPRSGLAIVFGSLLMWILFLWVGLVMRKLNRITTRMNDLHEILQKLLTGALAAGPRNT
ncbi:MAG: hypothetical protein PHU25_15795 [Deltaproteobacteria bacterium]|nr:hypothetical protein [Deltaproteobacteria bacterium]